MKVDSAGRLVRVSQEDLDENGGFFCDERIVCIGMNAFYDVRFDITRLGMRNVEKIEHYACQDCIKLQEIKFSQNLKEIGYSAFYGNFLLHEIVFPKSLTHLGKVAFRRCSGLQKVEFFSPLARVDDSAEQACFFLANDVFKDCKHIKKFVFHGGVNFNRTLGEFRELECIEIGDKEVAKSFWRDLLSVSPQGFRLLDSKLFLDRELVKTCLFWMQDNFEKQLGGNEKLAEALVSTIFENKLKIEEEKFGYPDFVLPK